MIEPAPTPYAGSDPRMCLSRLGPLRVSEAPFASRIRIHQAWYRREILGLDRFGQAPPPSRRHLGSILHPDDADRGRNYISPAAASVALKRRQLGWGVDEYRCQAVMTSSQTMTVNVLGHLATDQAWAQRCLSEVLGTGPVRLLDWWWEWSARQEPKAGPSRTLIDFLMILESPGGVQMLAFETKLADRYVSRVVPLGRIFLELAEQTNVWPASVAGTHQSQQNQLLRVHSLALEFSRLKGIEQTPTLVLLAHDHDPRAESVIGDYADLLRKPHRARHVRLGDFIRTMEETAHSESQILVAQSLKLRYVDLDRSHHCWDAFRAQGVEETKEP